MEKPGRRIGLKCWREEGFSLQASLIFFLMLGSEQSGRQGRHFREARISKGHEG